MSYGQGMLVKRNSKQNIELNPVFKVENLKIFSIKTCE